MCYSVVGDGMSGMVLYEMRNLEVSRSLALADLGIQSYF